MHIPIQNIYYLLCYAWDRLEEKEKVRLSLDDTSPELVDLFARILMKETKRLFKKGLFQDYINESEEVTGVKGKLLVNDTIRRATLRYSRTVCEYDQFSPDVLINQLLFSTILQLIRTVNLPMKTKKQLLRLAKMFPEITPVKISLFHFQQIKVTSHNKLYGLILNVCEMIHNNLLPTQKEGEYYFMNFVEDERKMAILFETFIRNFYRIEQKEFKVRREDIYWNFSSMDETGDSFLPKMQTDITLESPSQKFVIDAKFYKEAMNNRYGKEKINSSNLYQLFSYLLNQEDGNVRTQSAIGILLYPTVEKEYDLKYQYKDHIIWIRTVNLNTDWRNIHNRLLYIIKSTL